LLAKHPYLCTQFTPLNGRSMYLANHLTIDSWFLHPHWCHSHQTIQPSRWKTVKSISYASEISFTSVSDRRWPQYLWRRIDLSLMSGEAN